MKKSKIYIIFILLCLPWWPPARAANNAERVDRADFAQAGKFTESNLSEMLRDTGVIPNWIPGGRNFWYVFQTVSERKFILVDWVKKLKQPLFDRRQLARELGRLAGKTLDYRNLPLDSLIVSESRGFLDFVFEKNNYRYRPSSGLLEKVKVPRDTEKPLPYASYSPDRKWAVYTRNYDLHIKRAEAGAGEIRLTRDSSCHFGFDLADYDYVDAEKQDPHRPRPGFVVWSPDSEKFVALRTDVRHLKTMPLINSLTRPRPSVVTYRVSLANEPARNYQVWVYNRVLKKMIRVRAEKWPAQEYADFSWSHDASRLYMVRKSKDQLRGDLLAVDPQTGHCTVLIEERQAGMILTQPVTEVPENGGIIWWSRRNGFGNYYLYDSQGMFVSPLTQGRFNPNRILFLDEKENKLYFTANGDNNGGNPYFNHLFRVDLKSRKLERLTEEDAHHHPRFSPDGSCFLDNFSRPDQEPRTVLRDREGRLIMNLETADLSVLVQAGWDSPQVFSEKAADNRTDIWGVMWKPFNMKPGRKYPVITFVYPGPQDEFIPWDFFGRLENVHLAQYGFIALMYGNRGGSQLRSLEYSEHYRGNLRDYGIEDKKVVIERLAGKHPFIDLERVGVWGGSSGGYMAVTAMLTYPDFFKVGISRSGIQDPELMYRWWGDSFHGMEETGGPEGRIELKSLKVPSNLDIAQKLKGRLLLIQGEIDPVVPPANALRMADVLMRLNKRFDLILVPGGGHGPSPHWNYIKKRVALYFIEHLMGDSRFQNRIDLTDFMGGNR